MKIDVPGFQIDKTEVTVGQYKQCTDEGVCAEPETGSECTWGHDEKSNYPVNCLTWKQADQYCTWTNKRLCSESEWEKAARGGCETYKKCQLESRTYPWGEEPFSCELAVMYDEGKCGEPRPSEVGSKSRGASPYGILNMSGNVAEWVADCWHKNYNGAPTNGSAWTSSCGTHRTARGGGAPGPVQRLRVTYRYHEDGNKYLHPTVGFRCCR